MKKTFKFLVPAVAAAALFLSSNTYAQTKETVGDSHALRFGIGLNLGVSTNDAYGFVPGVDLRLQKDFATNISGILTTGYTNFIVKDKFKNVASSYGYIPLKAGIKVFPTEKVYVSGELGAAFGTESGSKTAFLYSPGVGIGLNNGLDLGLRYEGLSVNSSNLGQVALRIAYGFKL